MKTTLTPSRWQIALAAFLFFLLACCSGYANDHDEPEQELFSDDNLLIVDIILGKYRLAGDVFIYTSAERTVVPLQPILDAVEFPIHVDPVAGQANGWFLREGNEFSLNAERREVVIDGQIQSIAPEAVLVSDGFDLYVDIELLRQWFPFETSLDIGKLRLIISSASPLPLERQLEREKQRKLNRPNEQQKDLPHIDDHYRWLGAPVVDVNIGAITQRKNDANSNDKVFETDASYSVQGNLDVLKTQTSFSVARSDFDSPSTKRLTVYKRPNDLDKTLPGGISYIAAGDTFGVSDALIFNGGSGLGADIQFGEERNATDFGKRAIEGEATPGWEIELYRNNALVDFVVVGDDGRYRFEDVPVEYGENIFDVRLFGPQGQEQARRESIRVGETALPKGSVYGRVSHNNLDQNVFNENNTSIVVSPNRQNEKKTHAFFQYGVHDKLSTSLTYAKHQPDSSISGTEEYLQAGITAALSHAAVGVNVASQLDGGEAYMLSAQSQIGSATLSYAHKYFSSFVSDRSDQGQLKNDVELRVTGTASWLTASPWSYQFLGNYVNNVSGGYSYTVENRLGFGLFHGRTTIDTEYADSQASKPIVNGRARYLRAIGSRTNIRASLDYKIHPDWELSGGSTAISWRPTSHMRTQIALSSDFVGSDNNSADINFSYLFDAFTLSANTTYREGGLFAFALNLEFSLSPINGGRWRADRDKLANYGRVKAQVFLDNNGNQIYDDGDQPISHARFTGFSDWHDRETDDNGIVYLSGLRSEQKSRLKFDAGSLEDPYWKTLFDQRVLTSHGGGLQEVAVPVVMTVEVEGTLMIKRGDLEKPLAGVPIIFTDPSGNEVARVISEFDGYFIADGLVAGDYRVNVDPSIHDKLGTQAIADHAFSADAEAGITYLGTIYLNVKSTDEIESNEGLEDTLTSNGGENLSESNLPINSHSTLTDSETAKPTETKSAEPVDASVPLPTTALPTAAPQTHKSLDIKRIVTEHKIADYDIDKPIISAVSVGDIPNNVPLNQSSPNNASLLSGDEADANTGNTAAQALSSASKKPTAATTHEEEEPSAGSKEPSAENDEPSASNKEPSVNNEKSSASLDNTPYSLEDSYLRILFALFIVLFIAVLIVMRSRWRGS